MHSDRPVIVKRSNQSSAKTQRRFQPSQQLNTEPVPQPDIEQPEQPQAVVHLESLAETRLDASVYGSGWSITDLMDELGGRYEG